jgi:hypothetical protein
MDIHSFLATQNLDQLKAVNNTIVGMINKLERGEPSSWRPTFTRPPITGFKRGDLVEFRDKRGGVHRATITTVNTKTCSCIDADTKGKWRVSPTFLRLVGADKVEAPKAAFPGAFTLPKAPVIPAAPVVSASVPTAVNAGAW